MSQEAQGKKHIFVVNDDPAILELFSDLLGDEGYQVTVDQFARQTSELQQQIRTDKPDLIIMDYIIGREGAGWQLLQTVRMDRETRHIPVIVCTGAVRQVEELRPHLNEMAVQIVLKPFDIDHLIDVINTVWIDPTAPRQVSVSQNDTSFEERKHRS